MNVTVPVAPPDPAESVAVVTIVVVDVEDVVVVVEAFDASVTRGAFLSLPILRREFEAALLIKEAKSDNNGTTDPEFRMRGMKKSEPRIRARAIRTESNE